MNEIKTLQVIGSGGAFDAETNSSFLITTTNEHSLLIDCGYNVFEELRRLEKENPQIIINIHNIVITHMDDDHMGSLKTLLYYRYFVLGLTTFISGCKEIYQYTENINHEMKSSVIEQVDIVIPVQNHYSILQNISINIPKVKHHIEAHGIIIRDRKTIICISGDTKATEDLYTLYTRILTTLQESNKIQELIFHDFSFWNAVSRQVHACKNDCISEYPEHFLEKAIMYHNNKANLKGNIYDFTHPLKFKLVGNETTLKEAIENEN